MIGLDSEVAAGRSAGRAGGRTGGRASVAGWISYDWLGNGRSISDQKDVIFLYYECRQSETDDVRFDYETTSVTASQFPGSK